MATQTFDVAQAELDKNVTLIQNRLINLLGYQSKGYLLVPMY